jgi:hypothetical protein
MECNANVALKGDDFRGWKLFVTGLNLCDEDFGVISLSEEKALI